MSETKKLGTVTAYGYAKSAGYTGTEEEFAQLMADYAEVGEDARSAANAAQNSAAAAATAEINAAASEGQAQAIADGLDTRLNSQDAAIAAIRAAVGSPLVANTAAAMTDTEKVYVYTGSESGYTAGNWYYYDGTAWASGGVYNSAAVETDTTLSVSGVPADAKAAGDEIDSVKGDLSSVVAELDNVVTNNIVLCNYELGGFNAAGYFESNHYIHSNILPAGWYNFSGLTGFRFSVYKYIDDSSGEQITTYRTDPISYQYNYNIILVVTRDSTDTSALTSAEINNIKNNFSVEATNNDSMQGTLGKINSTYIQDYDASSPHSYLEYVKRSGYIYQAKSDYQPEAWTAGHWNQQEALGIILRDKLHSGVIAPYYNRFANYSAGDYVLYANKIRKARQDIEAENWTEAHWDTFGDSVAAILDTIVKEPTSSRFDNYAHRGDRLYTPFNTLPSFAKAKQLGYNAVEFDVRFTSDGVPVILHDATINATARNADGSDISEPVAISSITYAEALEYDFGIWFSADYAGTKIPTLAETLSLCKKLNLRCAIEIKQTGFTNVQAKAIVDTVLKYGWMDNSVFTCFTLGYLKRVYNNNPRSGGYVFTNGGNDLAIINNANDATGLDAIAWFSTIASTNRVGMAISRNYITQETSDALESAGVDLMTFVENTAIDIVSAPSWASKCITEQVPDAAIDNAFINNFLHQ